MNDTQPAPAPMDPGTYLRKRREAAGLSIDDVARMLGATPGEIAAAQNLLRIFERDNLGDVNSIVDRLPAVFAMDADVYHALCLHAFDPDTDAPLPQVCRVCACSWNDPCQGAGGVPCSWIPGQPNLCTFCVGKDAANDGEAGHAS
jgi:transcriptional regulator with XRE-family HTH domain